MELSSHNTIEKHNLKASIEEPRLEDSFRKAWAGPQGPVSCFRAPERSSRAACTTIYAPHQATKYAPQVRLKPRHTFQLQPESTHELNYEV